MLFLAPKVLYRIGAHRDFHPIPNPYPGTQSHLARRQERPMMWYIFEKEIVQEPQKECFQVKNKNLETLENLENLENL